MTLVKRYSTLSITLIIIVSLFYYVFFYSNASVQTQKEPENTSKQTYHNSHPDPFNATYTIDGHLVTLTDGSAQYASDVSSAATTYTLYRRPVYGDIGNDGDADAAVVIAVDTGGTGTFYYGTLIENRGDAFVVAHALYIGDRIIPEYITLQGNEVTFVYLDRALDEAMTVTPSHERVVRAVYDAEQGLLVEAESSR